MRPERAERARTAGYSVRPLAREDVEDFRRVHAQVWRDTYTGVMRQEALDALDPVRSAQQWRERMDAGHPVRAWLAIAPDGTIAGMASYGPSRDDDAPVPTELYAINVLAAHHGTGVADLLLTETIGAAPASLWVVASNARARAFYTALGFVPDGREQFDEEYGVGEVRLVRWRSIE